MVIDNEKFQRYQAASNRPLTEHSNPDIAGFYRRLHDENSPLLQPAYAGQLTFFSAPSSQDLGNIDIALVGIPMDTSAPLRAGAKFGPKAIREWSKNHGPIHPAWEIIPFDMCRIADYGDVDFARPHDTEQSVEDIFQCYRKLAENNVVPLSAGGVHTVSHPILKGLANDGPLALVHIDAHADTYAGDFQGEPLSDAAVFRNAVLDGAIDPEKTIQIGIRGRSTPYWEFSHTTGMRVITMDEVDDIGLSAVIEEAHRIVGDNPCYLTVDCDAIDACYMSGTQLPEPFGFTSREMLRLIRGLRGLNLIGADVVELAPAYDPQGVSSTLAAGLFFEELCLLAEARVERSGEKHVTCWR
ncbi:MAG: agmatinase [Pseudomonadales bacterium]